MPRPKAVQSFDTEDLQYRDRLRPNPAASGRQCRLLRHGRVAARQRRGCECRGWRRPNPAELRGSEALRGRRAALLAAHANPNAGRLDLPLAEAAYHGDVPALKLLLANGANPNTNSTVHWLSTRGGGQLALKAASSLRCSLRSANDTPMPPKNCCVAKPTPTSPVLTATRCCTKPCPMPQPSRCCLRAAPTRTQAPEASRSLATAAAYELAGHPARRCSCSGQGQESSRSRAAAGLSGRC